MLVGLWNLALTVFIVATLYFAGELLCKVFPDWHVVVFLATNHIASQHGQVTGRWIGGEKHFAAVCCQALASVSMGACSLEDTKKD